MTFLITKGKHAWRFGNEKTYSKLKIFLSKRGKDVCKSTFKESIGTILLSHPFQKDQKKFQGNCFTLAYSDLFCTFSKYLPLKFITNINPKCLKLFKNLFRLVFLDLTMLKVVKWFFLSHFWPIWRELHLGGSWSRGKNLLKANRQIKLSLSKSLMRTVATMKVL